MNSTSFGVYLVAGASDRKDGENGHKTWPNGQSLAGRPATSGKCHVINPGEH
jgi:hypothetical protein